MAGACSTESTSGLSNRSSRGFVFCMRDVVSWTEVYMSAMFRRGVGRFRAKVFRERSRSIFSSSVSACISFSTRPEKYNIGIGNKSMVVHR